MKNVFCARDAALIFSFLTAGCAAAYSADRPPIIQDDWTCGKAIELTPDITAFLSPSYIFTAPEGASGPHSRSFVAGTLRDPAGGRYSMLFVDGEEGWKAYPVEEQAGFSSAFMNEQTGRTVLFSMINVEGPGQTYTVVSTDDGFKTVTCSEIAAPPTELGTTDYMQIDQFRLDGTGKGKVEGSVSFGDESRKAECFEVSTENGGKAWSAPKKKADCVDNQIYSLSPAPEERVDDTLAALRAQSGL